MFLCAWFSFQVSTKIVLSKHIVHDGPALATLPLLLHRALSPCISYHLKSGCLKSGRAALGFIVEVRGRSGSGALSHGTSHQSNLWPTLPLITRLLMALSLGENQSVAKDDGRWSLQPITEWLRTAEGTNQSFTQKLKATYVREVYAATYGLLQTIYTFFFLLFVCFFQKQRGRKREWEHARVRAERVSYHGSCVTAAIKSCSGLVWWSPLVLNVSRVESGADVGHQRQEAVWLWQIIGSSSGVTKRYSFDFIFVLCRIKHALSLHPDDGTLGFAKEMRYGV